MCRLPFSLVYVICICLLLVFNIRSVVQMRVLCIRCFPYLIWTLWLLCRELGGRIASSRQDEENLNLRQWKAFPFSYFGVFIHFINQRNSKRDCLKLILNQVKTNWLGENKKVILLLSEPRKDIWGLGMQAEGLACSQKLN